MPAEDHFINRGLLKVKVNDFLRRELRRAGYAGVDLQKTPLGMRVVVYASRPGMVIGRRGTTVRELTETLEHEFGLEAPQIEVSEVEVPELNGAIMAERLAQRLERGDHFRRAAYGVLRRIVGAGAKGVKSPYLASLPAEEPDTKNSEVASLPKLVNLFALLLVTALLMRL